MIIAKNVHKHYFKQQQRTLKELIPAVLGGTKPVRRIEALNGVNFELKKGEALGVLGRNGAGKSTLLKLIAGVTKPTKGEIKVEGQIAPLIELGAGFHPELTGRENIYLNAAILGLSKEETDDKFEEIVKFSELENFIDTPVKHYSSGMYTRLGFSVAINVDFDILLTDEILAVGDIPFQEKCMERMEQFKTDGKTIVFVSHSINIVEKFCTKGLVLHQGKQIHFGEIKRAASAYEKIIYHPGGGKQLPDSLNY